MLDLDLPLHLEKAKRERLAVALYDAQVISQGAAAERAQLSRAEFLTALAGAGVSAVQYTADEAISEAKHN